MAFIHKWDKTDPNPFRRRCVRCGFAESQWMDINGTHWEVDKLGSQRGLIFCKPRLEHSEEKQDDQ